MGNDDYHNLTEKYLEQCDKELEECRMILDTLEGILEITPKPSESLGW